MKAAFIAKQLDTCAPFTTTFTNTSRLSNTPAGTSYLWDFGDGTKFTGANPPNKKLHKCGYLYDKALHDRSYRM